MIFLFCLRKWSRQNEQSHRGTEESAFLWIKNSKIASATYLVFFCFWIVKLRWTMNESWGYEAKVGTRLILSALRWSEQSVRELIAYVFLRHHSKLFQEVWRSRERKGYSDESDSKNPPEETSMIWKYNFYIYNFAIFTLSCLVLLGCAKPKTRDIAKMGQKSALD